MPSCWIIELVYLALPSVEFSHERIRERKRRLGQYAIISKDGKPTRLEPDEIKPLAAAEDRGAYNEFRADS